MEEGYCCVRLQIERKPVDVEEEKVVVNSWVCGGAVVKWCKPSLVLVTSQVSQERAHSFTRCSKSIVARNRRITIGLITVVTLCAGRKCHTAIGVDVESGTRARNGGLRKIGVDGVGDGRHLESARGQLACLPRPVTRLLWPLNSGSQGLPAEWSLEATAGTLLQGCRNFPKLCGSRTKWARWKQSTRRTGQIR